MQTGRDRRMSYLTETIDQQSIHVDNIIWPKGKLQLKFPIGNSFYLTHRTT